MEVAVSAKFPWESISFATGNCLLTWYLKIHLMLKRRVLLLYYRENYGRWEAYREKSISSVNVSQSVKI